MLWQSRAIIFFRDEFCDDSLLRWNFIIFFLRQSWRFSFAIRSSSSMIFHDDLLPWWKLHESLLLRQSSVIIRVALIGGSIEHESLIELKTKKFLHPVSMIECAIETWLRSFRWFSSIIKSYNNFFLQRSFAVILFCYKISLIFFCENIAMILFYDEISR